MQISINDKTYDVEKYTGQHVTVYYYKHNLVDQLPDKCSIIGYVETVDGDKVGVVKPNMVKLYLIVILVLALAVVLMFGIVAVVKFISNLKDKSDFVQTTAESTEFNTDEPLVTGQLSDTEYILTYNRYCILKDNTIDIQYENVNKEATINIRGDGIKSEPVKVGPEVTQATIPVETTDELKLPDRVLLIVTIDGTEYKCPFVLNDQDSIDTQPTANDNTSVEESNSTKSEEFDTEEYYNPSTFKNGDDYFHD